MQMCVELRDPKPTGAFKIAGGLHYFECNKGNAKALDLIYAPSSNSIRSLPFASACQKVPSTMPVSYLSKADKNLAVAGCYVMVAQGLARESFLVAPARIRTKFFTSVWEK